MPGGQARQGQTELPGLAGRGESALTHGRARRRPIGEIGRLFGGEEGEFLLVVVNAQDGAVGELPVALTQSRAGLADGHQTVGNLDLFPAAGEQYFQAVTRVQVRFGDGELHGILLATQIAGRFGGVRLAGAVADVNLDDILVAFPAFGKQRVGRPGDLELPVGVGGRLPTFDEFAVSAPAAEEVVPALFLDEDAVLNLSVGHRRAGEQIGRSFDGSRFTGQYGRGTFVHLHAEARALVFLDLEVYAAPFGGEAEGPRQAAGGQAEIVVEAAEFVAGDGDGSHFLVIGVAEG